MPNSRETELERYLHEAQGAMFHFQMIEEALKSHIAYAHEAIQLSLPPGVQFRSDPSEYESAPMERLLGLFAKVTNNEPLCKQLNQLRELRNYCAHRAFAWAFLSEFSSSIDFKTEYAKVKDARQRAEKAFDALQLEVNRMGETRNAAIRAKKAV